MKLTALLPLLLVFTFAAPTMAQDKSYADVRHLYEKALLAAEETEGDGRTLVYGELSWDLLTLGDLELLARIPAEMKTETGRAIYTTFLALGHAQSGSCKKALELADWAFRPSFVETLAGDRPQHGATTALKALVRAYARCGAVERAEEVAEAYAPSSKLEAYRADVESAIAASLWLAGDQAAAERYFAKARARADGLDEEGPRLAALRRIAFNQIAAGRDDEALETIRAMGIAFETFLEPPRRYAEYEEAFEYGALAVQLASKGRWELADGILAGSTKAASYYSPVLVALQIERIASLDRETRLQRLDALSRFDERDWSDDSAVLLARAYADLGEEARAIAILEGLLEEGHGIITLSDTVWITNTPGEILKSYVLMGRPQEALDKIVGEGLNQARVFQLPQAWGALIGYARLHGDEALRRQVEPSLEKDLPWGIVHEGIFVYYLDQRAFEEAEREIEHLDAFAKVEAYRRLAGEMMGVLKGFPAMAAHHRKGRPGF